MTNPYAGYTDSSEVVANYLLNQFIGNMALFTDNSNPPVAVQAVWYGDPTSGAQQGLIPTTPAVAVIPGPESNVYQGVGARPTFHTFQTFAMVYYGKLQDIQLNTHASLTIANKIKRFSNTLGTFGGLIIDCLCTAVDPGVALSRGALYDTTRMTFVSRSKTTLDA